MKFRVKPTMLFVVVGLCLVLIYVNIDPAVSVLMPKCLFKTLTGYDCPSCGGQRALHALLNGRVYDAFMLNPFLFLVAPYILAVLYSSFSKSMVAVKAKPFVNHYVTISIYLFVYILWWVVRNTEWWDNLV